MWTVSSVNRSLSFNWLLDSLIFCPVKSWAFDFWPCDCYLYPYLPLPMWLLSPGLTYIIFVAEHRKTSSSCLPKNLLCGRDVVNITGFYSVCSRLEGNWRRIHLCFCNAPVHVLDFWSLFWAEGHKLFELVSYAYSCRAAWHYSATLKCVIIFIITFIDSVITFWYHFVTFSYYSVNTSDQWQHWAFHHLTGVWYSASKGQAISVSSFVAHFKQMLHEKFA